MIEAEIEYSTNLMTALGTNERGIITAKNWKKAERKKKLVTSQCKLRLISASFQAGDTVMSPKCSDRGAAQLVSASDVTNSISVAFHEL